MLSLPMYDYFTLHNQHNLGRNEYLQQDPQLSKLASLPYVYWPSELDEFKLLVPGIYTLSGGRQIGKSTLLKQWILQLIKSDIPPETIFYLTGELIDKHQDLVAIISQFSKKHSDGTPLYIICDEVTYISDWDKGVKFLADAGELINTVLMLSGSDSSIIKEARNRFPGRRGDADKINFHFSPLSFKQTVHLKQTSQISSKSIEQLFEEYLIHGGFLTAINKYAIDQKIPNSTYLTYGQWIIGDMTKRGKSQNYLFEIFSALVKRLGSQITWNSLAKDLSIDHHKTISDYINLLTDLDVLYVQHAILEDKMVAAPKKAKKVYFKDPFIFHAINSLISQNSFYFIHSKESILKPEILSYLVEQISVIYIENLHPNQTFYIKAEGEVDIAYIKDKKLWPIEIKWTQQIRAKDIKQIRKYKNGQIWGKFEEKNASPSINNLLKELLK